MVLTIGSTIKYAIPVLREEVSNDPKNIQANILLSKYETNNDTVNMLLSLVERPTPYDHIRRQVIHNLAQVSQGEQHVLQILDKLSKDDEADIGVKDSVYFALKQLAMKSNLKR